MHKKLEADLISIAHRILRLQNKEDVAELYTQAKEVYEKLAVLNYIDNYVKTTPNNSETKEEIIEKIGIVSNESEIILKAETPKKPEIDILKEVTTSNNFKDDAKDVGSKKGSFENEMKDAISADLATDLFEKAEKVAPKKKSLNDQLQSNIQVGLNDRIAFVKHLFNHSQEDFNRVLSQLNSFKTEKEATNFIQKMVKSDYDWTGKEEYEERLINLIERKFN